MTLNQLTSAGLIMQMRPVHPDMPQLLLAVRWQFQIARAVQAGRFDRLTF